MNDIERALQSVVESISVINETNGTMVKTIEGLFSYIQELQSRITKLEHGIAKLENEIDNITKW